MKRFVIPVLLAIAGLPIFFAGPLAITGCQSVQTYSTNSTGQVFTNTTTSLDPNATKAARVIVAAVIPYATSHDSNSVPYLRLVAGVFSSAADSGNYDPASISAAMENISIKEIRGSQGDLAARAIFAGYKGFFGDQSNAKIDAAVKGAWLRQILLAISNGISDGLPPA
jgi:hypothetical protein